MKLLKRVLVGFVLVCGANSIYAQQQMPPIPIDQKVRIGKLDNGLTYYIRHNELPENQADFYIAQKVGSILEDESQRGLAHFLEHMCFNGTTNFPGDTLIKWLESIGVKFGVNLNAYTSVDETVYNINNVPVVRESIADSCLLILHDWANDLTLSDKEIDKERGVIHEEWRTRTGAMMRMYEKVFPEIYPDSKYGHRLPIGLMSIVDNFPYQDLRDYYEKWYRPDQQGIIVVGDVDVDKIEQKIKSIFSSIEMPENAAKREYFPVPDNVEPIITIGKDKEMQVPVICYAHKHDVVPDEAKGSISYLPMGFIKNMIEYMLNSRLVEITQKPNAPFIEADVSDGNFFLSKTKGAFMGTAVAKEDGILSAIYALATEIERVRQFGFTASEYARAKADYLRGLETAYNERDKQKNTSYSLEYVRHFIDNEPIPGIDFKYTVMNQIVPTIPVEAVNQFVKQLVGEDNIVLSLFCPDKESMKYPTKEELKAVLDKVKATKLEAYVDKVSNEPLMKEKPAGGKVVKTENGKFGSTVLTLSNGVEVELKTTDFKADEILMTAMSAGGTSLYDDKDAVQFQLINPVVALGGLGNFSAVDLDKVMAGKVADVSTSVNTYSESVSGSCSPKDLETMLQLTYLHFTAPRMDREAFTSFIQRNKAALTNAAADPSMALSDSINVALYNHHPRAVTLKAETLDLVDYDKIMSIYKDRFADASDFRFTLVGNIDMATAIPLIEQYLGALPSINRKENYRDVNLNIRKGQYENNFVKEMQTPKATILIVNSGKCKFNLKNNMMMNILGQLLRMVYIQTIREENGGSYSVSCNGALSSYPKQTASFEIYFDTDPAKREHMVELIYDGINKFIKEGANAEDLAKVKEYVSKNFTQQQKENAYWLSVMNTDSWEGYNKNAEFLETLNSITSKDLQKFAKKFFGQNNIIEVSMSSSK